ncbi:PepSY domain-containing protein [Phenylobacterium sp.]|uniref:PepSY domain-containing protein n=1 Tax=Phenylobacterium sp. TaxID=1871053 RepID=UPI002BE956C2|nr:PepSY domain-containing protein [Phenylobacterium sp.]HVI31033.1 PepSY domain-containing protein [Phenylobacterium sp.]
MKPLLTACAAMLLGAGSASAAELCSVPVAEWQPRQALEKKLAADGWKVKRLKTEDGCYEVYGLDRQGRRVEAYFNPRTLQSVKVKVER